MGPIVNGRIYRSSVRPDQGFHTQFDCPVGQEISVDHVALGPGELRLCGHCLSIVERQRELTLRGGQAPVAGS